jgi:hypothetical protein
MTYRGNLNRRCSLPEGPTGKRKGRAKPCLKFLSLISLIHTFAAWGGVASRSEGRPPETWTAIAGRCYAAAPR